MLNIEPPIISSSLPFPLITCIILYCAHHLLSASIYLNAKGCSIVHTGAKHLKTPVGTHPVAKLQEVERSVEDPLGYWAEAQRSSLF